MAIYSAESAAARGQVSGFAKSLITSSQKQPCSEGRQDDGQSAGPERQQCRPAAWPVQDPSRPRASLLCLPRGDAWDVEGSYLGRVHQPPGVQQAEAVLMAVAEAGLVDVPLRVTILVLKRNAGHSRYPGAHRHPRKPGAKGTGPEGKEAQKQPTAAGKQTLMALLERNRLTFV